MSELPPLALSVRQPWAWAIVAGYKTIENRTAGAIKSGRMGIGPICIHAATGLKQGEFKWAHWRLERHGVACPRPETLVRGAIIGTAIVTALIDHSDSEWFGGPMGLVLENPREIEPIPAQGALGYFKWTPAGTLARPTRWMKNYDPIMGSGTGLFESLPLSFKEYPKRPRRSQWGKSNESFKQ